MQDSRIVYKSSLTGDMDEVQKIAINRALTQTEECIESYCSLPSSHNGRYVNSDLFKEIFPEYSQSIETRGKYDLSVHNSCAFLAQELFYRMIEREEVKGCIFVTGIPGAGKSFFIQSLFSEGQIPEGYIVFEGNLCNINASSDKMQRLMDSGKDIKLVILDTDLKLAYENMKKREEEVGRGATLFSIANIRSKIKSAIETLNSLFSISEIGVYTKIGFNDNVFLKTGIEAVREIVDFDFDGIQIFLREMEDNMKGLVQA